jgi:hypothetical protein
MKTILTAILVVLFCANVWAGGNCYDHYTDESWGSCVYHEDCRADPSEWYKWCEGLPDVDGDGIVDSYDPDTLFGFITGENHDGVPITIARIIGVAETDIEGYYAFGGLESGEYIIVPTGDDYFFGPEFCIVPVE